jgi:hypothetical protein
MVDFEPKKLLVGLVMLIFFFTVYERLTNPSFLVMIGLSQANERNTGIFISFISPLIIIGVITSIMFFVFGVHPITSFMVALVGFIAYFLFTSPVFFSILGLTYSEQTAAIVWVDYLRPIFITGIILAAVWILIQTRNA